MLLLTLLLGTLVGFSLGMTGGGGAIFAVPLLVYVLGIPTREAVGISLLTVGSTAMVGFIQRARHGLVEFPTGILFALAGMIRSETMTQQLIDKSKLSIEKMDFDRVAHWENVYSTKL